MDKFFKNKKFIIILILLVIVAVIIPIGYALFSDIEDAEEVLKIGKVEVILEEDWPEYGEPVDPENPDGSDGSDDTYDEFGIEKYTKSVKGVSVAEQDAYVRIRVIPVVEYYVEGDEQATGEWITASVAQEDIILAINTDTWVRDGDYWYYKKVLKGFEKTESLNIDWQVTEIPSEISKYPIRTDVKVMLDYAQASNNMWKDIFQIEDLPAEVERVQE